MTPAFMKKLRAKLQATQKDLATELECSERYIQARESGEESIDRMLQYALFWLLLPKKVREKYTPQNRS